MLDERQLALKPIVGESVGHNARVSAHNICSACWESLRQCKAFASNVTTQLTGRYLDCLQHPCFDRVTLRRGRRYSGPGIIAWILLLLRRHRHCLIARLLAESERRRECVLLSASG